MRLGNLFVHCIGGSSRSPVMLAAWMHRCGYAAIDKALAEIAETEGTNSGSFIGLMCG